MSVNTFLQKLPTPMAGLALAIASLGWCWENYIDTGAVLQHLSAMVSLALLVMIGGKFLMIPSSLKGDLSHKIIGSAVPTYAMALMIVSSSIWAYSPWLGISIWLLGVGLHLSFLVAFIYHRARDFHFDDLIPGWFVPPVGMIVGSVAFPGGVFEPVADGLLIVGMVNYLILLPVMINRFIFGSRIPEAAMPTVAIMAAPASLSLAGYLASTDNPHVLLVATLFGISLLMTLVVYLAFIKLLRLPFTPGYAAFTFPMVIGSTALYKTSDWLVQFGAKEETRLIVEMIAEFELYVATAVVGYVAIRYVIFFGKASR